jgi:hypothetical protein
MFDALNSAQDLGQYLAAGYVLYIAPGGNSFLLELASEVLGKRPTVRPRVGYKDPGGRIHLASSINMTDGEINRLCRSGKRYSATVWCALNADFVG